jgi:hypothetical protein
MLQRKGPWGNPKLLRISASCPLDEQVSPEASLPNACHVSQIADHIAVGGKYLRSTANARTPSPLTSCANAYMPKSRIPSGQGRHVPKLPSRY